MSVRPDIGGTLSATSIRIHENLTLDVEQADAKVVFGTKNTLVIDPSLNRVGVNVAMPSSALDVSGNSTLRGTLAVGKSLSGASLDVSGFAVITSDLSKNFIFGTGMSTNQSGMWFNYDMTNNRGTIQSEQQGVAYRNLTLNPNGGNVGIGLTNPSVALDVNGYVKTNPIGFNIVRNASSPVNINPNTRIPFSSTGYDIARVNYLNCISGNGVFTAPINGYYFFTASAYSSATDQGFSIRVDATSSITGTYIAGTLGSSGSYCTTSAYAYLNVNQTVSIWSNSQGAFVTPGANNSGYLVYAG